MELNAKTPVFAVVGHPNKGKSSIVAALTHTDTIAISALSGTTTQAQNFSFYVDGQVLYQLVDTPGFQRPRQMLELLEQHAANASQRITAIGQFLAQYAATAKTTGRFHDEIELLTPIMAGAGIIYVVDGSVPYSPEYEAEMTLLQWTGQPRMALINPIGGEQYLSQWQAALGQFFSLVRVFNPMTDGLEKQCAILLAFAELCPPWRQHLLACQQTLVQQQQRQQQQAAYAISRYIAKVLAHVCQLPLPMAQLQAAVEQTLQQQYKAVLHGAEEHLQKELSALYAHHNVQHQRAHIPLDYPDLFDQGYWYLFGLTRQKLVALSAGAGAAAGGIVDLGLGGASFMAGAVLGGITSAAASFYATAHPEKPRLHKIPLGGKQLTIGPVKNLQFAFVLLGRAICYQQAIAQHSYANRQALRVDYSQHSQDSHDSHDSQQQQWLQKLNKTQQLRLTRLLQKGAKGLGVGEQEELQAIVKMALF